MLRHQTVRIVCLLLFWMGLATASTAQIASTPEPVSSQISPIAFVERYEKAKLGASFDRLRQFGQAGLKKRGDERLADLFLVSTEYMWAGKSDEFVHWNDLLNKISHQEKNDTFIQLSNLNVETLKALSAPKYKHDPIKYIYQESKNPLVKSISLSRISLFQRDTSLQGDSIRKLGISRAMISENDKLAYLSLREYWANMAENYLRLNDIKSAITALSYSEFSYTPKDLKSPIAGIFPYILYGAGRTGDEALARRTYMALDRLAQQSGDPSVIAETAVFCADLEYFFYRPKAVLACLNGVDLNTIRPEFLQATALSNRALARARLNQTKLAEVDFNEIRRLQQLKDPNSSSFDLVPLIEAQLHANHGEAQQALQKNTEFWQARARETAKIHQDSIHQLTSALQADVEDMRQISRLQKTVIRLESLATGLAIAVALAAGYAVFYLRRVNRKLDAARLAAEEANQAKSQFLANISHEIRTPLNGVLGLAQAISADELTPIQAERIGVLRQSGLGLLAILNDLLDLAKIEAGKLSIEAVPFNPQKVLTAARQAIWATAEAKGLTVETTVMPEAEGLYKGDPTRLRQIIDNLVSNAVKFTPTGRVDVVLSRPADALVLTVADTGIGMTPEATSRIFTKFEQADASTTRRFGGSGLGLSICLELAEAMGGAIKADSIEGQGTTFTVILPLERLGDVQDVVAVQAVDAVVDTDQPPLRVLAAEDHPVNQLVLRTLLGQFGVEVTMASNGQEVLDLFKNHDWDVVLMDVQMPVMDGPTATRAIRQFERDQARRPTPILALTANAMAHQLDDYRQAGCNGHVSKPIDATDLISAMSRVLAEAEEVDRSEAVII